MEYYYSKRKTLSLEPTGISLKEDLLKKTQKHENFLLFLNRPEFRLVQAKDMAKQYDLININLLMHCYFAAQQTATRSCQRKSRHHAQSSKHGEICE